MSHLKYLLWSSVLAVALASTGCSSDDNNTPDASTAIDAPAADAAAPAADAAAPAVDAAAPGGSDAG